MTNVMQSFRSIIRALQGAIGEAASKIRPTPVLLEAAYHYVHRAATRLQTLFDRWQAGTLPKIRPSRAGRKCDSRPRIHFPTKFAWLATTCGYQACGHASQLQHLINQPDFTTFVTEVPRAARQMRPLRRLLGIHTVPPAIGGPMTQKPPRKRRPQTAAPSIVWPAPTPSFTQPSGEIRSGQRVAFARLPNHQYRDP